MAACSSTMWPLDVPEHHLVVWGVACAVLAPFIVILNVLLVYAMVKTKETSSFTSHLVICMSISDTGMGLIVMPLLCCMMFIESLHSDCVYQKTVQCIAYVFGNTSFFLLLAIGIDRYLLIKKLHNYRSFMTKFRLKIIISTIVVVSIALAIITITVYSYVMHLVIISSNILCIATIYVFYAKLLLRIDKQSASMLKEDCTSNEGKRQVSKKSRRRKRDISVARTIRILLGTIFLLYMPYNFISSTWGYYRFEMKQDPGLALNVTVFWTYVLMFINCMANVLIYGHGNSKIRHFVKSCSFLQAARSSFSASRTAYDSESEITKDDRKQQLLSQ